MAAFKKHASFSFWKANIMKDPYGIMKKYGENESMGNFGKLTSLDDLPEDNILMEYISESVDLNFRNIKLPKKPKKKAEPLEVPKIFQSALNENPPAKLVFEELSTSHKNEYIKWINDAKRDETKEKRIIKSLELLNQGLEWASQWR